VGRVGRLRKCQKKVKSCFGKNFAIFLRLVTPTRVRTASVQHHSTAPVQLPNSAILEPGNTKGGSITVPVTSCLTGLESAV